METIKRKIKKINILFLFLFIISLFSLAATLYLSRNIDSFPGLDERIQGIFKILMIIYSVLVILSAQWAFKRRMQLIPKELELDRKLTLFRNAMLIKMISIIGALLFSYVVILISGDYLILVLSGMMLIMIVYNWPNISRIKKDIQLSDEEIAIIEKSNS